MFPIVRCAGLLHLRVTSIEAGSWVISADTYACQQFATNLGLTPTPSSTLSSLKTQGGKLHNIWVRVEHNIWVRVEHNIWVRVEHNIWV